MGDASAVAWRPPAAVVRLAADTWREARVKGSGAERKQRALAAALAWRRERYSPVVKFAREFSVTHWLITDMIRRLDWMERQDRDLVIAVSGGGMSLAEAEAEYWRRCSERRE